MEYIFGLSTFVFFAKEFLKSREDRVRNPLCCKSKQLFLHHINFYKVAM